VCYFLGPLFTDWASGCYVRCGCIGSPAFQFSGGWGGAACPLVLCSLLLLSGSVCVLSIHNGMTSFKFKHSTVADDF